MKTFSHAIKGAYCAANEEIELFSYDKGPGVITEQWYTGYECLGPSTIIRYYVDNNTAPSIEMNLYMAHSIGFLSNVADQPDAGRHQSTNTANAPNWGDELKDLYPQLTHPVDPGILRYLLIS